MPPGRLQPPAGAVGTKTTPKSGTVSPQQLRLRTAADALRQPPPPGPPAADEEKVRWRALAQARLLSDGHGEADERSTPRGAFGAGRTLRLATAVRELLRSS